MWITKILTTALVAWLGLIPSSCSKSKNPSAQNAPGAATVSASAANKNLGEVSLTNHYETCVNLGAGKSCTIKPTLLDHASVRLTMALESKNSKGGVKGLSIVQVVTKSGEQFDVAVGGMTLTLTPILAAE